MDLAKRAYVSTVRMASRVAASSGLEAALKRAGTKSRAARWGQSLFAIYDIEKMAELDLPWWTFDAIEQVDSFLRDKPGARVFEYGSGASTVWLARRAKSVTSVEHDEAWHPVVQTSLGAYGNAEVMFVPPDAKAHPDRSYESAKPHWKGRTFHRYVHSIDQVSGDFDLIIIDGRARGACLAHASSRLAQGGLIVFDNTHRRAYRRAVAASPFQAMRTRGLTACLPYPDETTLLWRAA